jgi:hypothetical protein
MDLCNPNWKNFCRLNLGDSCSIDLVELFWHLGIKHCLDCVFRMIFLVYIYIYIYIFCSSRVVCIYFCGCVFDCTSAQKKKRI